MKEFDFDTFSPLVFVIGLLIVGVSVFLYIMVGTPLQILFVGFIPLLFVPIVGLIRDIRRQKNG